MSHPFPLRAALLVALALPAAASPHDLVANGDFELGDTSSWTYIPTATSSFDVTVNAAAGSFSGELVNSATASAAVASQTGLGIGSVAPGDPVQISFAARASSAAGGVAFVNFVSITAGGQASGSTLLSGGPLPVTDTWQRFCFTTTAASDVAGGVGLQFAAATGAAAGSSSTLWLDDVVVSIGELTTNGGFEAGDTGSWDSVPSVSSTFQATTDSFAGAFAGEVVNDAPASAAVVSQTGLGVGSTSPGDPLRIRFAAKGTTAGGGVAFANFISVDGAAQASASELLGGGPLPLTATWQTFEFTVPAGPDVTGGLILQFAAVTGASAGSLSSITLDDVSVTNTAGGAVNYCVTSPNSAGSGAVMGFSGSTSVAAEDFVIEASGLPPGQFYLFWVGQGSVFVPSFDGVICIGAPCRLYFPGQATAGGLASKPLPPSEYLFSGCMPPTAGTTYTYQCAYRDSVGTGVNWSDALCVTFGL